MAGVAARYAIRSVGRNARRTILSILGVAIGCALALFMESINRGRDELFARVATESGIGHLRVVPQGWRERRDPRLRLARPEDDLRAVRSLPGVAVVVPRARAQVLLAMGTHVVPLEMAGVDPVAEPRAFRFMRNLVAGRYLQPAESGAAVVGKAVAERLRSEVGDEVLASAVGRGGNIESMMLRIVGIVATGSEDIDAGICHVALADVERLTSLRGPGEVTVLLSDWRNVDSARARLAALVAAPDEVIGWYEIAPEFHGHMEQDKASSRLVSGIILLIVFLGIASAQLAAVLERRREFAVLRALGMSSGRMVRLVLQEAVALGLSGAALGMAIALPVVFRLSTAGLDFRRLMGAGWSFQGVIMEPIIYPDFGPWAFAYALAVALGATVLASLYPAWFALRTDPATALRVAQ